MPTKLHFIENIKNAGWSLLLFRRSYHGHGGHNIATIDRDDQFKVELVMNLKVHVHLEPWWPTQYH